MTARFSVFLVSLICVLSFAGCATLNDITNPRDIEREFVAELKCESRAQKDREELCVKWMSQAGSQVDLDEQFGELVLLLHNSGRLQTKRVKFFGTPSETSIESLIKEHVNPNVGVSNSLLNVICHLNSNLRGSWVGGSTCRFKKERATQFPDHLSHVSGYEHVDSGQMRWNKTDYLWIPDLRAFGDVFPLIIENPNETSLSSFLETGSYFCRGHHLQIQIATRLGVTQPYQNTDCIFRYSDENVIPLEADYLWHSGMFQAPQVSVIMVDDRNSDEFERLPDFYRRVFRKQDFSLAEELRDLDGWSFKFDVAEQGFSTTSAQTSNANDENVAHEVAYFNYNISADDYRNDHKCLEDVLIPANREREETFKIHQARLFEVIRHPFSSKNSQALKSIYGKMETSLTSETARAARLGIFDTDASNSKHCENPLGHMRLESCGGLGETTPSEEFDHGLGVSAVAGAGIQMGIKNRDGILGINPCIRIKHQPVDWRNQDSIPTFKSSLGAVTPHEDTRTWNISSVYPKVDPSSQDVDKRAGIDGSLVGFLDTSLSSLKHHLFVVSSGHTYALDLEPLTASTCLVWPACSTLQVRNNEDWDRENLVTVIGVDFDRDGIPQVWSGLDQQQRELKSLTSSLFEIAAPAGKYFNDDGVEKHLIYTAIEHERKHWIAPVEGVSFGVPQVAATAATMQQLYPDARPHEVRDRLMACARYFDHLRDNVASGILDVECTLDGDWDRLIYEFGGSDPILVRGILVGVFRRDGQYEDSLSISDLVKRADLSRRSDYDYIENKSIDEVFSYKRDNVRGRHSTIMVTKGIDRPRETTTIRLQQKFQDFDLAFYDVKQKKTICIPMTHVRSVTRALGVGSSELPWDGAKRPETRKAEREQLAYDRGCR